MAVPAVAPPVIVPKPTATLTVPGALLAHVPVPGALLSAEDAPEHTVSVPLIGAGRGFTENTAVTVQPEPNE